MNSLNIEKIQSETINWLRFPLAGMVVFIHSFGQPASTPIPPDSFSSIALFDYIRIFFSHILSHIAVPTFFFISGFLFFKGGRQWNFAEYTGKLKKRLNTLLIPYVLWNIIAVAAIIFIYVVKHRTFTGFDAISGNDWLHVMWDINHWGGICTWFGNDVIFSGPINLPLWFLRDLIVIVLLSPMIWLYVNKTKIFGIILLFALYATRLWPNVPGLNITALFFFSFGAYFGINKMNIIASFRKIEKWIYPLAAILLLACTFFAGNKTYIGALFYPFWVIAGVISAFCFASRLIETGKVKVNKTLSDSSFFIFAVHTVVILGVITKIFNVLLPWEHVSIMLLKYFLVPITCVMICLLLYAFMKRFLPRMLAVLTGGR